MSSNALRFQALLSVLFLSTCVHSCAPTGQPISKTEVGKIDTIIENPIASGNPKMLDNILDVDSFAGRIANNTHITMDAGGKERLKRGLKKVLGR